MLGLVLINDNKTIHINKLREKWRFQTVTSSRMRGISSSDYCSMGDTQDGIWVTQEDVSWPSLVLVACKEGIKAAVLKCS